MVCQCCGSQGAALRVAQAYAVCVYLRWLVKVRLGAAWWFEWGGEAGGEDGRS